MKLHIYEANDHTAFLQKASLLWQQQAVKANLAWGLLARYAQKNKPVAQMVTLENAAGEICYTGLQTEDTRPFILVGSSVMEDKAKELLSPLILKSKGLIAEYDLANNFEGVFPADLKENMSMFLYSLDELSAVAPKKGNLIVPDESHQELLAEWIAGFVEDVKEIGGNTNFLERAKNMIADKYLRILLENGKPVSMAGSTRSAGGVACLNYVYTPDELRGNGHAFNCVGLYCRELLNNHNACCLYAEEDNPISNHVYQKLGFVQIARSLEVGW